MAEKKKVSSKPIVPMGRFATIREKIQKQSKKSKGWKAFYTGLFGVGLAVWVGAVLFAVQYAIAFLFVKFISPEDLTSNVVNAVYQVIVYAAALAVAILIPWKLFKFI